MVTRLLRALALLAGVGLLALAAPHVSPWDMTRFEPTPGGRSMVLWLGERQLTFSPLPVGATLVLAAVVALLSSRSALGSLGRLLASGGPLWRWALGLSLLGVTIVPGPEGREIVLYLLLAAGAVALLTTGLWPALRHAGHRAQGIANWDRRLLALPPAGFAVALFGVVLAITLLGSALLLGRIPHVVDAVAQLFHARIFLDGLAWAPSPTPREFFELTHMVNDGRWYSQYPPGHTALLAAGLVLGVPWVVNPLAGAGSVALIYLVGRELFDERTARIAGVLGCLSPFLLIMSSSFMSHGTTLFFLTLFLWGLARGLRRESVGAALAGGLGLGWAICTRPMTALAVAAPYALFAATDVLWRLRAPATRVPGIRQALRLGVVALMAAAGAGALLAFNAATTGDPLRFGYEVLHGADARPGFGNSGWWAEPHTPARGVENTLDNLNALNQYLFGLPLPSLLLALVGLGWMRPRRWEWLLLASVASLAGAYFLYWYQDWAYGPRFLYAAVAPLLLLTARALTTFPATVGRWRGKSSCRPAAATLALVVCFAFALGITTHWPVLARLYARDYADGNARVAAAVGDAGGEPTLVLVPAHHYPSAFPQNDPLLRGPVVLATDLGPERNQALAPQFGDRRLLKLFSFETFELVSYTEHPWARSLVYPLGTRHPLTIEVASYQVSAIANGAWHDASTAGLGAGWKNNDYLHVRATEPGAAVTMSFEAAVDHRRAVELTATGGPSFGRVAIRVNGANVGEPLELYRRLAVPVRHHLPAVPFRAGRNALSFVVVDAHPESTGHDLGLDVISVR